MASLKNADDKANIALIGALLALLRQPKICCDGSNGATAGSGGGGGGGSAPFGEAGLFYATPSAMSGYASLRQVEQSDLLHARVLFENVAQTIIARHTFPGAGAQAAVIPALRQSSAGFDISMPVPAAPDTLALQSYVNTRAPSGSAVGDIMYWNGTIWTPLAASTAGKFLQTHGPGTPPTYESVTAAGLPQYAALHYDWGGLMPVTVGFTGLVTAKAANSGTNTFSGLMNPDVYRGVWIKLNAGWDGGAVTLTGTDATGAVVTFVTDPAAGNYISPFPFATFTSMTKATVGASAATATMGPYFLGFPASHRTVLGTGAMVTYDPAGPTATADLAAYSQVAGKDPILTISVGTITGALQFAATAGIA